MSTIRLRAALGVALCAVCASAWPQGLGIRGAYEFPLTPPTGPGVVRVGDSPAYVVPWLNLSAGYDSNVRQSPTNEVSSTLFLLGPGFMVDARDANKVFQLTYQANIGRYVDSEDDDYSDHSLRATLDLALAPRSALRLGYDYILGHDPRGSTDRPQSGRPDRYRLQIPSIVYSLGGSGSQGRLELYASDPQKRYRNNRATTITSDYDKPEFGAAFYWRAMPRTHVLAEFRRTEIDYETSSAFNGHEDRAYVGVTWEATAATTGTVKVGQLRRAFDSGLPRFSGASWEALVSWSPRSYSRLDFYSSRQTVESTGLGNFIVSDAVGIVWTHTWSSTVTTAVNGRFQRDDYQGFNREDETKSFGVKLGYKFRRWMTVGAEYNHLKRDSNIGAAEYDRDVWLVTAAITL